MPAARVLPLERRFGVNALMDYSLTDPAVISDPFEYYARMRAEQPVHFDERAQAWLVTRYEDVLQAVRMVAELSNEQGFAEALRSPWQDEIDEMMRREGYGPHIISDNFQVDPPVHARRRVLVEQAFSAQRVVAMESDITAIVREVMDTFIDRGEADIVTEFSVPIAIYVIGGVLNVPRSRKADLKRWSDAAVGFIGRGLTREQAFGYARDIMELHRFIDEQVQDRRARRGTDVISDLVHARNDDEATPALSFGELLSICVALLAAGNETTRNGISWGTLVLARQPEVLAALQNAEDSNRALQRFVEEVLRLQAPVPQLPRVATCDCTIGGVTIPKGSHVFLCFASANRDVSKFPDADQFQFQRLNAGQHLAFGAGIHRCLGAMLARMEMKCAFREIVTRMGSLELADPAAPLDTWSSFVFRGPKRLPVRFTRRPV